MYVHLRVHNLRSFFLNLNNPGIPRLMHDPGSLTLERRNRETLPDHELFYFLFVDVCID